MPIEDIQALVKEHMKNPSRRKAQHKLASEFVELVHGKDEASSVKAQHELMFSKAPTPSSSHNDPVGVKALELPQVNVNNRPKAHLKLPRTLVETRSIGKILHACGLAASASEGHRLAAEQAVHIGGSPGGKKEPMNDAALTFTPVKLWRPNDTSKYLIEDSLLIFRRGKHNIRIIEVIEDAEYKTLGLSYPGMTTGWNRRTDDMVLRNPELIKYNAQWADLEHRMEAEDVQRGRRAMLREIGEDEEDEHDELQYSSPEERIRILKEDLHAEQMERQRKIDKKNAPKGKFMGHGLPRGPVPPYWT
jgi:tyrosyl-tRNA synthetase